MLTFTCWPSIVDKISDTGIYANILDEKGRGWSWGGGESEESEKKYWIQQFFFYFDLFSRQCTGL